MKKGWVNQKRVGIKTSHTMIQPIIMDYTICLFIADKYIPHCVRKVLIHKHIL